MRRFRSARTGQYVTKAEAAANKDTTVSETIQPVCLVADRGRCEAGDCPRCGLKALDK